MNEQLKRLIEPSKESKKSRTAYFLSGGLIGVFLVAVLAIAIDEYPNEDFTRLKKDFGITEDRMELTERDYPTWMDQYVDPPSGIDPKDVYTFSCEIIQRKPTAFSTTCADFGIAIFEIKWSTWSAEGAKGSGVYSANDCKPSCAEGTRHEIPVYLWLTDATTDGNNYFLNTLRFVPRDVYEGKVDEVVSEYVNLASSVIVEGKTFNGAEWDLSDDWKSFPELRGRLPK